MLVDSEWGARLKTLIANGAVDNEGRGHAWWLLFGLQVARRLRCLQQAAAAASHATLVNVRIVAPRSHGRSLRCRLFAVAPSDRNF